LEAIGAGVGGKTDKDWVQIWRSSNEAAEVRQEITERKKNSENSQHDEGDIPREFATTKYVFLSLLHLSPISNHFTGGINSNSSIPDLILFSGEIQAISMCNLVLFYFFIIYLFLQN
jgi:hypothetical protein